MKMQQLVAGDSLNFVTGTPDYLPSAGWVLKYRLVPISSGAPIALTGVAEGDDFRFQVAATTTAGWLPGSYSWASWVDKAGEIYTVQTGQITILPDPRQVAVGYDSRSTAQIALASCEAAMATFNATGGKVKRYEIAGRTMEFQTIAELMSLHSFWRAKVAAEQTAESVANGLGNPRNLFVRFQRPG